MTISLTCACGARLEIDETFAGQPINCPDCQRGLTVPRPEPVGLRTSGLALASFVLALVGAFTILGTLLAIVFGALALRDLARRPGEVVGRRYALAGITLGMFLTVLTVLALTSGQLIGLNNLAARAHWAGKLDYSGPEEIVQRNEGYAITRPSPKWGVVKRSEKEEAHVREALMLVNVDEDAYLVCDPQPRGGTSLEKCREDVLRGFSDSDEYGLFGGKPSTGRRGQVKEVAPPRRPPPLGTLEIIELLVDKSMAGQDRRFLIRILKAPEENTAYVLIGGARRSRFARVEPEIRKALESFRMVDPDRPRD